MTTIFFQFSYLPLFEQLFLCLFYLVCLKSTATMSPTPLGNHHQFISKIPLRSPVPIRVRSKSHHTELRSTEPHHAELHHSKYHQLNERLIQFEAHKEESIRRFNEVDQCFDEMERKLDALQHNTSSMTEKLIIILNHLNNRPWDRHKFTTVSPPKSPVNLNPQMKY